MLNGSGIFVYSNQFWKKFAHDEVGFFFLPPRNQHQNNGAKIKNNRITREKCQKATQKMDSKKFDCNAKWFYLL